MIGVNLSTRGCVRERSVMANRSNRRRVSLSRAMAFEAAYPISPRRADAHHGQEAPPSANRPDIRAQSHLGARRSIHSCKPRVQGLISILNPEARRGRSIRCETERAELSTAARPPACQSGAQPAARPWITPRTSSEPETPTAFPCLLGGVHIRPTAPPRPPSPPARCGPAGGPCGRGADGVFPGLRRTAPRWRGGRGGSCLRPAGAGRRSRRAQ